MNLFWVITLFWAFAVALIALALAFVLPPLLRKKNVTTQAARRDLNIAVYRDQMKEMETDLANGLLSPEQFQSGTIELQTRLAEDALAKEDGPVAPVLSRRLGFTLAGLLPIAAFSLYFWVGNPAVLLAMADPQSGQETAGAPTEADIMQMIRQIEERAQANPDDGEAWMALARAFAVVSRWPQALQAYENAFRLLPTHPSIMTGYAEALAMTSNGVLQGRPMELVRAALQIDPDNTTGLELAGIDAYQREDFTQAAHYLTRLHRLAPPDSPYAQDILAMLRQVEGKAKPVAATNAAVDPQRSIAGQIDIAPALKPRLTGTPTIFLFARADTGSAPAAVLRTELGPLPLEFNLDDSMAMDPANLLSQHGEVELVARISVSGNPTPQPGDLEGRVASVKVGATGVNLVIDRVLP